METQFMVKKKTEVPPELLSKEFLKQFKTHCQRRSGRIFTCQQIYAGHYYQ